MAELTTIARPYAKAAYQFADSTNQVSEWARFLEKAALLVSDPSLCDFLKNPALSAEVKEQALVDLLQDVSVNGAPQFVRALAYYGRFLALGAIFHEYQNLVSRGRKVMDITISSAFALTDAELHMLTDKLKARYEGQDIRVEAAVDPSLMGGFEIRSSDTVIDATVRGRLAKMATVLTA